MPASAVASLTPAIAGISGTSVGASGEMAEDMAAALRIGETVTAGPLIPAIHACMRHSVAMRSIEPGISRFPVRNCAPEVRSFGPSRNDGAQTRMPGAEAGHDVSILK